MLLRRTARFAQKLRNGLPTALAVILVSQAEAQVVEGLASQTGNAPIGSPTPGGGALSGFSFTASVALTETYTSNGLGVPRSSGLGTGADFVSSPSLNLGLHKRTARFEGDLQYTLGGYLYAHNSSLNRVSNYLNALGRAVLVPEHVLLDVRAFAAPVLISRLGPVSADDRPIATGTNSGRRDTYGYTVSPDFLFRLGDFATSETTFSHGSVFFFDPGGPTIEDSIPGEPPPTQATVYGVTERFSSGSDFSRLAWILAGTASKSTHMGGGDLEQAAGTGDFRYALSRQIALLGTAGYASLTSTSQPLTHSLVGPIALGGLAIDLGPSFSAEFRAGWQFNYNSYSGRLHYELGPSTTLTGSLSDSVTTPALRFLGGLGQLNVNAQGDFFDTAYQLDDGIAPANVSEISVFNPAPIDQIGMGGGGGEISRYRAARLSLLHESERTRYRLTFSTVRDPLVEFATGTLPRENSTGVDALISHSLNRLLTGSASAGYSVHGVLDGQNTMFRTRAELTYLMTPVMTSFLRATYLHRLSDRALVAVSPLSDNLSDVSISIGIQRQLF